MGAKDLGRGVGALVAALDTLFVDAAAASRLADDFALYVEESPKHRNHVIFHLWCFNAGLALRSLVERGVRGVALTSGTLRPMASTVRELGSLPFPVQYVGGHVIKSDQVRESRFQSVSVWF